MTISSSVKTENLTGVGQNTADIFDTYKNPNQVQVQVAGTFVGTATFEASMDGATWIAVPMTPIGGGATVTTATAPGQWFCATLAPLHFRTRCSAFTSGTIVVTTAELFS